MSRRRYDSPRDLVAPGASWPEGPLRPDSPAYARYTAALVVRIRAAMAGRTATDVANGAGIDPSALTRLLAGETVPDLGTVAALEEALGQELWPGRTGASATVRGEGGASRGAQSC